jgi:hypothetical protein
MMLIVHMPFLKKEKIIFNSLKNIFMEVIYITKKSSEDLEFNIENQYRNEIKNGVYETKRDKSSKRIFTKFLLKSKN